MYNAETSIKRCLKSVINQSFPEQMEILVIDDGSSDKSAVLVKEFMEEFTDQRFRISLFTQKNKGVSSARNVGLKNAKGYYIALLDSDDEWHPNKLERQMEVLSNNKHSDFLGCARDKESIWVLGKKINKLHKVSVKELVVKMYPQTSTVIFKRSLFRRLGGYDENLRYAEDGDFWIRYCANSNFYYLPEPLVSTGNGKPYFGHSGISGNLQAMQQGNEKVLKDTKDQGLISTSYYYFAYVYSKLKYIRRILLTKARSYDL
jgi:glycosyltransferase involved in cell wall biosynthesis